MHTVTDADLHAYADGELNRKRVEAVQRHLAASPDDAAHVESWRRQNEMIRSAFPPAEAAQLPRSLLVSSQRLRGRSRHAWRERWFGYCTALAFASGALLTGTGFFVVSRLNEAGEPPARPVEAAAGSAGQSMPGLAAASLREFEARAGRSDARDASGRGTGLEVPVMPALAAEGLKLAGIRAIPFGEGQMLCFYYGKPDGSPIAFCAAKSNEPNETPARIIRQLPAAAISWRQKGAEYVLLGSLSEASLQKVAGELRSEIAVFGGK